MSDLKKELAKHPEKVDIALSILGPEAAEWWKYKHRVKSARLVDPASGRWVSEFEAGGKKYYVRSPKEGISLYRYTKLKQMLSVVGFDATFAEQMSALTRMLDFANSLVTKEPKLDKLFAEIENMRQSINNTSRNWDFSYYAATLFIVTADEDLATWDERLADEKIAAWNAAGYHEHDFFLLVMFWAPRSAELLNASYEQIQKAAEAAAR